MHRNDSVKAFRFSLETFLRLRERELELEQMKLSQLLAELARLDTKINELEQNGLAASRWLSADQTDGNELKQLQAYRESLALTHKQLIKDKTTCQFRITQQQRKVMEADRRKRLLDRLKERRIAEWAAEVDKEWESMAAETYLARWGR